MNLIFNWLEQICCSGEDTKRKMINIISKHEMWLKINRKKLLDPESQFEENELRADFSALKTIDNLWIRNDLQRALSRNWTNPGMDKLYPRGPARISPSGERMR